MHDTLGSVFNTTMEAGRGGGNPSALKLLLTLIMDQAGSFLLTCVLWVKLQAEVTKLQITCVVHSRIMLVALSVLTFLQMAQPPLFKKVVTSPDHQTLRTAYCLCRCFCFDT